LYKLFLKFFDKEIRTIEFHSENNDVYLLITAIKTGLHTR